jgi:predicted enzyme related to lactoylglutathione lyase
MAQLGGRNVAGLAQQPGNAGAATDWNVYFSTSSVDDSTRKVGEGGGQVLQPPLDVADQGRVAAFADPTGARFGVWQGKQHHGAEVVEEPGAMTWHELYTRDARAALGFYARVLGLEPKRLDAPGIDYWTLQRGPRTVCGLMQMTDQFAPEVPSHWNTYFAVADIDASAQHVTDLGGQQVVPPFDTPYGRMIVAADPFGAASV